MKYKLLDKNEIGKQQFYYTNFEQFKNSESIIKKFTSLARKKGRENQSNYKEKVR